VTAHHHRLIPLTDAAEWNRALSDLPHAFAHTWEHNRAVQASSGLETFLYVYEEPGGRVVCPLSTRSYRGFTDIVTPYGFGGFASSGEVTDFPQHWEAWAREQGYVCGYLALNPLFDAPPFDTNCRTIGAELFVLDLRLPIETIETSLDANRRRQLRHFQRGGLPVVEDRAAIEDFVIANQRLFFAEKNASPVYRFAPDTFRRLFESECVFALGAGTSSLEAAAIFGWTDWCADYLFGITLPEGRKHAFDLIWTALLRLKSRNVPYLNLGGGIRSGDGVAGFKARFGGRSMEMPVLKQIYAPETFRALCDTVAESSTAFFPPYHAPTR